MQPDNLLPGVPVQACDPLTEITVPKTIHRNYTNNRVAGVTGRIHRPAFDIPDHLRFVLHPWGFANAEVIGVYHVDELTIVPEENP